MHKFLHIVTLVAVSAVAVLSFHASFSTWNHTRNTALADGAADVGKDGAMATVTTEAPRHTNHLVNETSPYLLQHAHNPVDWYPWGDEAIQRARDEDKPIFLSIGYAACHWCHVMERESFEDEAAAAILNEHFVSVKVDREERPDLDDIYMTAVQAMTGSGGWPMTVFLTPDLQPFYGGTYFPPEDRFGMPGFKSVLRSVIDAWNQRRDDLVRGAAQLTEHIRRGVSTDGAAAGTLSGDLVSRAAQQLAAEFDAKQGGFGPAPKFPSTFAIALLFREYAETNDERLLDMATFTLERMAKGGMYDHLGGGFHRYSVDERWLVPHFEKMLYDNALLSQVYLEAYQVTGDAFFRRVAEETFAYVLRDMQDESGGFYSTEDADSEGQEGKFYVWTHDEIIAVLGAEDGALFCRYYNVRPDGNFSSHEPYHRGQNILHTTQEASVLAGETGVKPGELDQKLASMRSRLLVARGKRVRPGLDDKILTSWNALMISSLARGCQVLGNKEYGDAAVKAADFILREMMQDGELLHTHRNGTSRFPAYLDDYAFLTVAFVDLYEATFDAQWLRRADRLAKKMIGKFWDEEDGGFFFTSTDHENLIARRKPLFDGAEPSGNSMASLGLLRLAKLTDNAEYLDKAEATLQASYPAMMKAPRGVLNALCAVDFYVDTPREIAIAGNPGSECVVRLLETLHERFLPNKVVALADPGNDGIAELVELIPLLESKELVDGQPAAYVCRNFTCERPVTTPEAFSAVLGGTE